MPPAPVRFALETAFLILVALGAAVAGFRPIVIGVVMLVALVLVGLIERESAKGARRAGKASEPETALETIPGPSAHIERIELERAEPETAGAKPEPEAEPEPEPVVSERTARTILASASPPLPPEKSKPKPKPEPSRRRLIDRRPEPPTPAPLPPPPEPEPEPEPVAAPSASAREWNLWELQRVVRDAPDDPRREEWSAILIHLREFANADGDLPIEFDALVRDSFAGLLDAEPEPATAS